MLLALEFVYTLALVYFGLYAYEGMRAIGMKDIYTISIIVKRNGNHSRRGKGNITAVMKRTNLNHCCMKMRMRRRRAGGHEHCQRGGQADKHDGGSPQFQRRACMRGL